MLCLCLIASPVTDAAPWDSSAVTAATAAVSNAACTAMAQAMSGRQTYTATPTMSLPPAGIARERAGNGNYGSHVAHAVTRCML